MNVSKKLMKAISDLCWDDQSRYRELKVKLEESLSSRAGQGAKGGDDMISLVRRTIAEMHRIGVDAFIVGKYTRMGFAPILCYYTAKSIDYYSESEINSLVSAIGTYYDEGRFAFTIYQCLRKAANIITAYRQKGFLHSSDVSRETKRQLSDEFEALIISYRDKITEYRSLSDNTIASNCTNIRMFLYHLEQQGVAGVHLFSFKGMSDCMTGISKHYGGGLASVLGGIKQFLTFLFEEGITTDDFSITVPKPAKKRVIRAGFTEGEISNILEAVNRDSAKGKRDYAILLTAAKTGLRSIDIVNLRMQDIDWRTNEITITQQKTGQPLMLPLLPDVGNAIADYLLNARPKVQSDRIFLNYTLHHKGFNRKSITPMIKKYMNLSGIDNVGIPFRGTHSFRRGFGRRLLESGVDVDMINELLGHSEMNSSMPYLAIDENGLRLCGLELIKVGQEVTV